MFFLNISRYYDYYYDADFLPDRFFWCPTHSACSACAERAPALTLLIKPEFLVVILSGSYFKNDILVMCDRKVQLFCY